MKIAFGMIVFNGNHVLKECLESVYPFANQILIAEGPVTYWQEQGYGTSDDDTNEIIDNFPDPDNKITIVHSQYNEKDEQCNAYMKYLRDDNDYVWNLDSDEIFKPEDIEALIELLNEHNYTSVGFKSCTFYGGFNRVLGGFEERAEFHRVCRVYPGSVWASHRPPIVAHKVTTSLNQKHLDFNKLYNEHGIRMYHYSYVFPNQVFQKLQYYKAAVSKHNCIDNYFENIYLPWVMSTDLKRHILETKYDGVHEFKPEFRGECRTKMFKDTHPIIIEKNMSALKEKFLEQLGAYV